MPVLYHATRPKRIIPIEHCVADARKMLDHRGRRLMTMTAKTTSKRRLAQAVIALAGGDTFIGELAFHLWRERVRQ